MKKVLSLVLAIAMVLSSMSFAFAGTFEDVTDEATSQAVDALNALGVVKGNPDGTYKPENPVTRAEMAAMLVRALGHSDLAAGSTSSFKDAKGKWYDGEVAIAQSLGLTNGYPDGTFKGENKVSYTEAITMIMRALGYNNKAVNSNREDAYNATSYKAAAARLGILKDVKIAAGDANRGDIAVMLYNALDCQMVIVDKDGNPVGQTVVGAVKRILLDSVAKRQVVTIGTADLFGAHQIDVSAYLGEEVVVYTNDDDEILFVKESVDATNKLVTNAAADYDDAVVNVADNTVTLKYTSSKSKVFDVDTGTLIVNNLVRKDLDAQDVADIVNNRVHNAKFVAASGASDKDVLVIEDINYTILANSTYIAGKTKLQGITLPTDKDGKVDTDRLLFAGDAKSLEDIKVNDVIQACVAKSSDNIKFYVTRNSVNGTVTEKNVAGTQYYIDEVKYATNMNSGIRGELALQSKGEFFLDKDDAIAFADTSAVSNAKYGIILGKANGTYNDRFNKSVSVYPQIKMVNAEGKTVIYDIKTSLKADGNWSTATGFTVMEAVAPNTDKVLELNYANVAGLTNLNTNAKPEYLVKYTLNDDGKITKIEAVTPSGEVSGRKTEAKFLADNTTLILGRDTNGDYSLINLDKLTDAPIDYRTVTNGSNFGWEFVVIVNGINATSTVKTFAVINSVTEVYNGSNTVSKVTAYVDGVKVSYIADDKVTLGRDDVYALEFNTDGTLSKVNTVYAYTLDRKYAAALNTTCTAISSNGLRVELNDGASYHTLSANVVVYKEATTAGYPATLADLNDIRITNGTTKVSLYDKDADGVIDVIFMHK